MRKLHALLLCSIIGCATTSLRGAERRRKLETNQKKIVAKLRASDDPLALLNEYVKMFVAHTMANAASEMGYGYFASSTPPAFQIAEVVVSKEDSLLTKGLELHIKLETVLALRSNAARPREEEQRRQVRRPICTIL